MHVLVVHANDEDGIDYDIEHPPECICVEEDWGNGIFLIRYLDCNIDIELNYCGLESLPGLEELTPGRYELEFWSESHYSYYYGAHEYDCGLQIIRSLDEKTA